MTGYQLARYPESLAVVRLGPGAEIPTWAESSSVFSITATAVETSVVCAARSVPKKARHHAPPTGSAATNSCAAPPGPCVPTVCVGRVPGAYAGSEIGDSIFAPEL